MDAANFRIFSMTLFLTGWSSEYLSIMLQWWLYILTFSLLWESFFDALVKTVNKRCTNDRMNSIYTCLFMNVCIQMKSLESKWRTFYSIRHRIWRILHFPFYYSPRSLLLTISRNVLKLSLDKIHSRHKLLCLLDQRICFVWKSQFGQCDHNIILSFVFLVLSIYSPQVLLLRHRRLTTHSSRKESVSVGHSLSFSLSSSIYTYIFISMYPWN